LGCGQVKNERSKGDVLEKDGAACRGVDDNVIEVQEVTARRSEDPIEVGM